MNLPKISVIIPARPNEKITALLALQKADYPKELLEVFVSYGFSPSKQRNEAAKMAKGMIFYFLDSDSQVHKLAIKQVADVFLGKFKKPSGGILRQIVNQRGFSLLPSWVSNFVIEKFFSGVIYKGEIAAVGGPNVWLGEESFWAILSGGILESFFAHFLMSARYRPIGFIHRASEKELILCNLAIRRDIFIKSGGFNEILYPNEENELLNRIGESYQLIYNPLAIVFRPRRMAFDSLLVVFFHYGRGRMEQIRIEGIEQNILFLAPLSILIYIFLLFIYHPLFAFVPLLIYFTMAFASALGFSLRKKRGYFVFILPIFFFVAHLSYALGFIFGRFTDLKKKKRTKVRGEVKVLKIKNFGQEWKNKYISARV